MKTTCKTQQDILRFVSQHGAVAFACPPSGGLRRSCDALVRAGLLVATDAPDGATIYRLPAPA
ncbi:MAG TPA: hypothetical protein VLA19_20520 [Herpetosiphonaceae bacterium]|nr:hypothetical protein [Herpetosiphonaceae bacterium]